MPAPIEEVIRGRVIEKWLKGEARVKITADNNIGTGTVNGIIKNYKTQLKDPDFESVRGLAIEIKKQGLTLADLSSLLRLYNFFRESSVLQDQIEAFIDRVHSGGMPQDKIVEYLNKLYDISREQSIALEHVPSYVKQKLEEKQKIDHEIKEANDVLQTKNANIEAIDEYLRLKEALDAHGISTQDTDKLLNVLNNAKECKFDSKIIVRKLRSIRRLEKKHNGLKNSCIAMSKQLQMYEAILRLTEAPLAATLRLMEDIKKYDMIGGLERELQRLLLRKIAIAEACARKAQAFVTLSKMQNPTI